MEPASERETERERVRQTDRERQRVRQRQRDRENDGERVRETEREAERQTRRERGIEPVAECWLKKKSGANCGGVTVRLEGKYRSNRIVPNGPCPPQALLSVACGNEWQANKCVSCMRR